MAPPFSNVKGAYKENSRPKQGKAPDLCFATIANKDDSPLERLKGETESLYIQQTFLPLPYHSFFRISTEAASGFLHGQKKAYDNERIDDDETL